MHYKMRTLETVFSRKSVLDHFSIFEVNQFTNLTIIIPCSENNFPRKYFA